MEQSKHLEFKNHTEYLDAYNKYQQNNAVNDFLKAAQLNPNYYPPRLELEHLRVSLP